MGTVKIYGQHDVSTRQQIDRVVSSGAEYYVQCADGHLGYGHPIGGVAAYRDHISLSGVSSDISCGMAAIRTNLKGLDIHPKIESIMDEIYSTISFGVGRKNEVAVDHSLFDDDAWKIPVVAPFKQLARDQLGTVGSGNHFCNILVEQATDNVWIAVHFGSRGLGYKIASYYLKEAGAKDDMMAPPALIRAGTPMADDYLAAAELAGRYAKAGRDWVLGRILEILGGETSLYINNHHNFVAKETHFGESFWVVRKGATQAYPGQLGFVGGSMGDDSVVVEGVEGRRSRDSLYSTVHGAGRIMSRASAKGKPAQAARLAKDGKTQIPAKEGVDGLVDRQAMDAWLREKGVTLRGGDVDEAPQAYRRLEEVLKFHKGTIKILHTLSPLGVAMAGTDVRDPYRD